MIIGICAPPTLLRPICRYLRNRYSCQILASIPTDYIERLVYLRNITHIQRKYPCLSATILYPIQERRERFLLENLHQRVLLLSWGKSEGYIHIRNIPHLWNVLDEKISEFKLE